VKIFINIKKVPGKKSEEQIKDIIEEYNNPEFNSLTPAKSLDLCGSIGIIYEAS
jgi:hypothetical protein